MPGTLLGLQSLLALFWWLLTCFAYVQSDISFLGDPTLAPTIPIDWWWTALQSPITGWMAASYLSTFIAYIVVAVPELLAWLVLSTGYPAFARTYFSSVGYWGSVILYAVGPTFAMMHMLLPES